MNLMLKSSKALNEMPIEAKRFLGRAYPSFVLANKPERLCDETPVFMFHSVERDYFEAQLDFLQRNQYQTLTMAAFMAFLRGELRLNQPSVLLTFDDGHKNWYEVAYPLLKAYGFHAVGFLVPTYIRERPSPGVWLSWPEVLEMEQSGVMSFESHTAHHDQVFVGPKLVDFYHPAYEHNPLGLDTPWIDDVSGYTNHLHWGTPIYRHASRFSGHLRYLDDVAVRQACVTWLEEQGGDAFFTRPGWRQALHKQFATAVAKRAPAQYESEAAQRAAILSDLTQARQLLTEKLERPVQHLCYPWGAGSELALALSREAGYASNFWVVTEHRNSNRPGDNPFYIPRLKDDYLLRLPGTERQPLTDIFLMKLRRRSQNVNIY